MDTLFDISPEEPVRSKGKRPARAQPIAIAEEPEVPVLLKGFTSDRPRPVLGRIDHKYECADGRCGAECHDILYEDGGHWLIECVFCGTGQWVKAIKGHLKPRERGFVLHKGRFAGLTLDEVEAQPRGMDYIVWAAADHPSPAVKDACKRHLDKTTAAR